MNNILKILLIFSFLTNCSFNKSNKFWSQSEKIEEEKNTNNTELVCKKKLLIKYDCILKDQENIEKIFSKEEPINKALNTSLKIKLLDLPRNKNFFNNYSNNNGRINYDGNLKKVSRFKFSKIDNFFQYNPEIHFIDNNIIFFDNKGAIFKFDNNSDLIWKKNYYSKVEKKQNPILAFANDKKTLIVADNISNYYALDSNNGELLWMKKNGSPFNSQIKIFQDMFFIIDFQNVLRAYSVKNGKEIWNIKTESTLVRSQNRLSIVIMDKKIYFNNSLGDISAVDIKTGELIWQTPTQNNLAIADVYLLKNSEIIADSKNLYFSNNKNKFFSIDMGMGFINWQQKINSILKPTIIENYIFTISNQGFLIIIDKNLGNIIKITDLFKGSNKKYLWEDKRLRDSIIPIGFIVGTKNIYLTTNKGKLYIVDIETGQTIKILKIDNQKISRPSALSKNLYIAKDDAVLKLN